jgi:hypothetical protein
LTGTRSAQFNSLVFGGDHIERLGRFLLDWVFKHGLVLLGAPGFGSFERLKRQGAGINLGRNGFRCFRRGRDCFFLEHGSLFWCGFRTCCGFGDGGGSGSGLDFLTLFAHRVEYGADTLVVNGRRVAFDLDPHVYEFFHQFFVGQPDLFC